MQPWRAAEDGALTIEVAEDVLTLLGVREDGVASVVYLVPEGMEYARRRAETLLADHTSCKLVEIWRDGALLARVLRA